MLKNVHRLADIVAAAGFLVLGVAVVVFVFPSQIPEGLRGDFSAGAYPKAIMIAWIAIASAWLIHAIFSKTGPQEIENIPSWKRTASVALLVVIGFGLFSFVGFIIAGFFLIASLGYVMGERGMTPWIVAACVPAGVYFFLLQVLEVRLPSAIF